MFGQVVRNMIKSIYNLSQTLRYSIGFSFEMTLTIVDKSRAWRLLK